MPKRIEKIFFVSVIIASQNVAMNCRFQEDTTFYKESMG